MGFLCPLPLLPLGSREDKILHRTDYLTGADQKIPNWSIKITFLVVIETAIKLLLLSRFSRVQLCATPETAAHQAPPSLEFSRQEYWSGLPFPSPMHESESESEVAQSYPTLSDPHGLQPARLLHPLDFPGQSTGVGCHCN